MYTRPQRHHYQTLRPAHVRQRDCFCSGRKQTGKVDTRFTTRSHTRTDKDIKVEGFGFALRRKLYLTFVDEKPHIPAAGKARTAFIFNAGNGRWR